MLSNGSFASSRSRTSFADSRKSSRISSRISSFGDLGEETPMLRIHHRKHSQDGPTHWILGIFILINAIIGAGILTLPYGVLHSGGLIPGLMCEIAVMVLSLGSSLILGWLTSDRSMRSMQDICAYYLGRTGQTTTSVLLVIFYWLACVAYVAAMKDQIAAVVVVNAPDSIRNEWYLDSRFVVCVTTLLFVAPLCFLPEIDHLKHICSVAGLCIFYVAGLIIAGYYDRGLTVGPEAEIRLYGEEEVQSLRFPNSGPLPLQIWFGLSSFLAAYTFQPTAALVYDSLAPRTYEAYIRALLIAILLSGVFYNVIVIYAALTFDSYLQSHILLNYDASNPLVIAGCVAYTILLMMEYPLIHFVAREGLLTLVKQRFLFLTGSPEEWRLKILLATVFITSSVVGATLVPHVLLVIQFAGIPNGVLVWIIPGLCLMQRMLEPDVMHFSLTKTVILWLLSFIYIIFGAFFLGFVTVQAVYSALNSY